MSIPQNYFTLNLSVPALERILVEAPEFVVQLQQGVIEEFARRHIKAITTDKIEAAVKALVAKEVGAISGYGVKVLKPTSDFNAALNAVIQVKMADYKAQLLEEATAMAVVAVGNMTKQIEARVKAEITAQTAAAIKAGVAARLKELLESA